MLFLHLKKMNLLVILKNCLCAYVGLNARTVSDCYKFIGKLSFTVWEECYATSALLLKNEIP